MKKILLALMLAPAMASAIDLDDSGSLKLTGFYSITGAKVLSGSAIDNTSGVPMGTSSWDYMQWHCPCSMQNWEYVGMYEKSKGWQFDQESLVGVQIKKDFSPTFSATAQLISRANNPYAGSRPTVDWAYLTWQPSADSAWTYKVGRFRIPLYYYSDYLYIGYAYPWVRPAPDVYGWPIFTYDGANVSYSTQLGTSDWAMTASAWTGSFTQTNDAYYTKIYYGPTPTHDAWKKIVGSSVAINNGIFDFRLMYMHHNETSWQDNADGTRTEFVSDMPTHIMGFSGNMDYKNWLIKAEVDQFRQIDERLGFNFVYKYALAGVGYQYGNWTPMYTYSRYTTVAAPIEGRSTQYLSLRWDFMKNTALKVQYDISKDKSEYSYPFFGDSKVLSISLQGVF
jgi:hypothetical protein